MSPLHFLMCLFKMKDIYLNLNVVLYLISSWCWTVCVRSFLAPRQSSDVVKNPILIGYGFIYLNLNVVLYLISSWCWTFCVCSFLAPRQSSDEVKNLILIGYGLGLLLYGFRHYNSISIDLITRYTWWTVNFFLQWCLVFGL